MIAFTMLSSEGIAAELAGRVRRRRLAQNLSQEGLASRSGVPLGTLKKFESTGKIAFVSFIQLVVALRDEAALEKLLLDQKFESLDDVLEKSETPKRGRIK